MRRWLESDDEKSRSLCLHEIWPPFSLNDDVKPHQNVVLYFSTSRTFSVVLSTWCPYSDHLISHRTITMAQPAPMPMPVVPPGMQPGMQPQQMQIPVNPALQTLLDSLPHNPVPFALQSAPIPNTNPPQINTVVTCLTHKASYCEACGVDFNSLNYMQQFLRTAPAEAIPPPPNVQPPPQRAEMIKNAKEAGNVGSSALSTFS